MTKKSCTTRETAAILGVTAMRVRAMLNDKCRYQYFPNAKKHGRDWLIPLSDIKKLYEKRQKSTRVDMKKPVSN
jgi:hypothetical protein